MFRIPQPLSRLLVVVVHDLNQPSSTKKQNTRTPKKKKKNIFSVQEKQLKNQKTKWTKNEKREKEN